MLHVDWNVVPEAQTEETGLCVIDLTWPMRVMLHVKPDRFVVFWWKHSDSLHCRNRALHVTTTHAYQVQLCADPTPTCWGRNWHRRIRMNSGKTNSSAARGMCNKRRQCVELTCRQKEWDCGMLRQGGGMIRSSSTPWKHIFAIMFSVILAILWWLQWTGMC